MKLACHLIFSSFIYEKWYGCNLGKSKFYNSYICPIFKNKLQELKGIELMPHTVYSPFIASSYYSFFQFMAPF